MNSLRKIRKSKKLTQGQLSKLTGILVPNISAYENSKLRMREDTIRRFAIALNVRTDKIMEEDK